MKFLRSFFARFRSADVCSECQLDEQSFFMESMKLYVEQTDSQISALAQQIALLTDQVRVTTDAVQMACRAPRSEIDAIIDKLNSQPFAAFKTWLDRSLELSRKVDTERNRIFQRENELLERWRSHMEILEQRLSEKTVKCIELQETVDAIFSEEMQ